MGVTPPSVNPSSVGMQALQGLQQQGQQQARIRAGQANLQEAAIPIAQQAKQQALIAGALSGNQQAQETLARTSAASKGTELPGDEILRMADLGGVPRPVAAKAILDSMIGPNKTVQFQLEQAEKMKESFGGDLGKAMKYVSDIYKTGKSDLTPDSMTMDQRLKVANLSQDILKRYPTMPAHIANVYASLSVTPGMEKQLGELSAAIAKNFPSENDIAERRWTGQMKVDMARLAETVRHDRKGEELDVMNAVRSSMSSQFDEGFKILLDKQSTGPQQDLATRMIADAANKLGTIEVNGKKLGLGPGSITTKTVGEWKNYLGMESTGATLTFDSNNPSQGAGIQQALMEAMSPPEYITDPEQRKEWVHAHTTKVAEMISEMEKAGAKTAGPPFGSGSVSGPGGTFPIQSMPIPPR
jgi:hypothetical protein